MFDLVERSLAHRIHFVQSGIVLRRPTEICLSRYVTATSLSFCLVIYLNL